MDFLKKSWHRYHYKNLTYLLISIIISFILFKIPAFQEFLYHLGNFGYIGAFISGMLFVSTFTISIATVILIFLSQVLDPIEIGVVAGLGAVLSDLTIFHFIRNKGLIQEIDNFFKFFGSDHIKHLLHTKYFSWTLPVI